MAGIIKKINVNSIINYFENPRHAIANSEEDTLKKLFSAVGNQYMINLADDIKKNGLLGSQQVVVVPDETSEKYIVYEGNRRIAAIKLLLYPDRFSFLDNPTLEKAKRISQDGNISDMINCYITDENEAFFIMERVHSGEDRGRGTKQWTAREKEAFKVRQNREKTMSYLVDYYIKQYFSGFDITTILPFTTIQRIFNNREVKNVIGLNTDDETTFTSARMQLVIDASKWIVNESATVGIAVTRLFNKSRSIEEKLLPWIEEYNKSGKSTNTSNVDASTDTGTNTDNETNTHGTTNSTGCENNTSNTSGGSPGQDNNTSGSGGNKNLPYFFQGLMYGDLNPSDATTHGVTAICNELRLFSEKHLVNQYPIASAYLVRALIEQSIIYYSKHTLIQGQNKLIWENIKDISKLSKIIENYKRNLSNYITNATVRQHFTYLFGNYEDNVDPLNWVVHRPAEFRLDTNTLIELPRTGLLALINYLISPKE